MKYDELVAYHTTFKSDSGAMVLEHLKKICHMGESTFVAGDPQASAFQEGERNVMIHILNVLAKEPDTVNQLADEVLHGR